MDAVKGLELGGDIVRYLFSIFPVFDLSYSLIGLSNTQSVNNLCLNYVDNQTLYMVCEQLKENPLGDKGLLIYLQCCGEPYVMVRSIAMC